MVARQENPKIHQRLRRVRLFPEDVRAVCELMTFDGPPSVIKVDSWRCDSVADIETITAASARNLRVVDASHNLEVTCSDARTMIRSTSEPNAHAYLAERKLLELLRPLQRRSVDRVRSIAYWLILLAFGASVLLILGATVGFERSTNPTRSYIAGGLTGVVLGGLTMFGLRKIKPFPCVILDRDAWENRGVLKKHGTEIGIGVAVLTLVVSIIIALLDD